MIFFCSSVFVPGKYKCYLSTIVNCSDEFDSRMESWIHAKEHGLAHFKWVCRLCPDTVFMTAEGMKKHCLAVHPEMKEPEEVVHPDWGTHYSYLGNL